MDEAFQGAPGCPVYNWPMADAVANAVARISQGGDSVFSFLGDPFLYFADGIGTHYSIGRGLDS